MPNLNVEQIVGQLINNPRFVQEVRVGIDNILKDGKIDSADIPDFVTVLSISLEKIRDLRIHTDVLPEVLTKITKAISDKYNLIPDDKEEEFLRGVEAGIRLLLFKLNLPKSWSCIPCL